MTLVSPANNVGYDTEFIISGKSFICITNSRDPEIDSLGGEGGDSVIRCIPIRQTVLSCIR